MATTIESDKVELAPIVFRARGLKPDVSLKVFKREFHVHSIFLKLHSAFFQKFLDPPNNSDPTPVASINGFKYHWVTKIDDDGSWVLGSSADTSIPIGNVVDFKGDSDEEETSFEKLLFVFYNREFRITNLAELKRMTNLADYYLSLPALSASLYAALHRSHGLHHEIYSVPEEFLIIAKKLRSSALFKEALILSLGPFRQPKYLQLSDPELRRIAEKTYNALTSKVLKLLGLLTGFRKLSARYNRVAEHEIPLLCGQDCWEPCWAEYFRNVEIDSVSFWEKFSNENQKSVVKIALRALMKSELQFDKSIQSGSGKFKEYFLCSEIEDEVLPWDPTEMDW